ncbi:carbonic anhydrase [bacterium]|jgi:carbonic anhydrase|nr:carbonic anhydrase [bacterium]
MCISKYSDLLDRNKVWVGQQLIRDDNTFKAHAEGQSPPYLFLGCSDSRVVPNEFLDLSMGELFVQRNIANQASLDDLNWQSVLEYAVTALNVPHVIVCGHYGCGGVMAAYTDEAPGTVKNWIAPIRTLYLKNKDVIDELPTEEERLDRLSELNVQSQLQKIAQSRPYLRAVESGKAPKLHGWMFRIETGLVQAVTL